MTDLINTLESPGEFDALTSLRPGEPYFLLVGRDRLAPRLVQQWADDNRARTFKDHDDGRIDDETRDHELRKSTQAEAIGWSMKAYKAGHEAKAKALSTSSRPTYTEHELPEEARHRDAVHSARIRAASALNTAVADLATLAELEGRTPLDDPTIASLRELSADITPARPVAA
jgi:hypothetical protein